MRFPDGGSRARALPGLVLVGFLLLGPSAGHVRGDSGGPDAYGYTWVDSRFPNPGVAFSWIDGVTGGTQLTLSDDGCTMSKISFGFPFRFYGITFPDAYVCANGFITFSTPAGRAEFTDAYVAAMSADLDPSASGSGKVYVWTDTLSVPRRFVVTWDGTYTYATTEPQYFQIVLIEEPAGANGKILVQYRDVTNPPPHLAGIENLGGTSSLFYSPPLEDQLAVMFLPPGSPPPEDTLVVRGTSLAPTTVEPGSKDVPMLRLNFSTTTNSVSLRGVRVQVTGLPTMGDVARMAAWRDVDADGGLNTSVDTLLVAASPAGSPATALLTLPAPVSIPAGADASLLFSFDVSVTAFPSGWIGAGVLSPAYVTVDSPDVVSASNFPFNTYLAGVRTSIVEGIDTLRVTSWAAANPASVSQWQTDVPMLSFSVDADKGAVTLTGVTASLTGTPPDRADVRLAKLYLDDGDLSLDPEQDALLDRDVLDVTRNVTLSANAFVIAGTPQTFWVAFDIAPNASIGNRVGVRIADQSSLQVAGTKDLVAPDNLPLGTASASLVVAGGAPALRSRWAIGPPVADGMVSTGEYVMAVDNARSLGAVGGNMPAWLVVENDATFLYLAVDVVGDETATASDAVSLAFDTDETAFPGAPAEDQFVIAPPVGVAHAVYNATAGWWDVEDPCNATFNGNHTGLACTMGFGRSPLSGALHRMYEFRVPLALLEVPLPIPANYMLGFALGGNWSAGAQDGDTAREASWPLVDAARPPEWFGSLNLTNAPPPNALPILGWTGEPGFVSDGVDPDIAAAGTVFLYHVRYRDSDGDWPSFGEPRLHVLEGGVDIPGSPFAMGEADAVDRNVTDGKVYAKAITFADCPRAYAYFMSAQDDRGAFATPTPTLPGPTVTCPPRAPELRNGTVMPTEGFVDRTVFEWSVEYSDVDGDAPTSSNVTIRKGALDLATWPLSLTQWLGAPGDYVAGARYGVQGNLSFPGADYAFVFAASDSLYNVSTGDAQGPTVVPEPADLLLISFVDEALRLHDQGARNVKMFTALLQANENSVDVTSLRIDRSGPSFDSDVTNVTLYHDVDGDGTISGPDALLGRGAFTASTVTFSFFVTVTAGNLERFLAYVDLSPTAVPDDRIGLSIVTGSYVGVTVPDQVAPFASFQTSQVLVNAAPRAAGLAVEGAANGSSASLHITTDQPVLSWVFTDPNSGDNLQSAFDVSVFEDATGLVLWSRNETGFLDSVTYQGGALADGARYRVDVKVSDGRLWSPTASLWFRMNSPPLAPPLVEPADGATNAGPTQVVLVWTPSFDAEADAVSYEWSLAQTSDFASPLRGTTVSVSVAVSTVGSTTYFWRVRAFDGREWGVNSTTRSFSTAPTSGGVRGRVLDNQSTPLPAFVRLFNATGALAAEGSAAPDGTFVLLGVPLGTYRLRVTATGHQERNVTGIALAPATPVVDVGDIVLLPLPDGGDGDGDGNPPPSPVSILLWIAVAVALILSASGSILSALAILRRRGGEGSAAEAGSEMRSELQPPELDEEALALEGEAFTAEALAEEYPEEERSGKKGKEQRPTYECPECGTTVDADAVRCPTCGALFE